MHDQKNGYVTLSDLLEDFVFGHNAGLDFHRKLLLVLPCNGLKRTVNSSRN